MLNLFVLYNQTFIHCSLIHEAHIAKLASPHKPALLGQKNEGGGNILIFILSIFEPFEVQFFVSHSIKQN